MSSRRAFVRGCCLTAAGLLLSKPGSAMVPVPRGGPGAAGPGPHPTPRPGITGAKVLTAAQLEGAPHLIPLFDGIRERPEIADGIRCNCGCAGMPGYYSLLSCYEGDAMARQCPICQGQGRLATRLHKAGKSLAEIRVAIDAQFDG